ncbi:facilitated trehalose transporter Tret1-like [Fopius arisanus]|uniref:Facilitated trehalose transporter Tret1-like n=1 Tax=Fopius arisanus TaxID=64838 RepID=A0A0C9RCE9_9HYME|nr:PREDICTED: facilitated trehalose transporter Tret1-like [Fopius arisanus]
MNTRKTAGVEPGKWKQFFATIIINLSSLAYGLILGWSSPMAPLLQSEETPIGSVPMTSEQMSWMNGMLCVGALGILPFCSPLAERFGRKITGCIIAIPSGLCWLLILLAVDYTYLWAARLFAGIAAGLIIFVIPIYISEITGDTVRGQYGSILVFSVNIGILMAYIFGAILRYNIFAICALVNVALFLGGFLFMPETPIYLMRKGRIAEATRSLMWLKGNNKATVEQELSRLQALAKENTANNKSVGFSALFRDRGTFKGFMIAIAMLGGQQFCGISAVVAYTATIFKMAGSSLQPNIATVLVGGTQVLGSWLSTLMMERAGRRPLIMISSAGMAICHCILGAFLCVQSWGHDVSSFSWIPVIAISGYAIVYCLGMGPAPYVVASEVFSSDISGFANSIAMVFMWIVAFLNMKYFPFVMDLLGIDGAFFLLAAFCICTLVFTFFFIPETKGRDIESILDELNGFSGSFRKDQYQRTSVEIIGKNNNHAV